MDKRLAWAFLIVIAGFLLWLLGVLVKIVWRWVGELQRPRSELVKAPVSPTPVDMTHDRINTEQIKQAEIHFFQTKASVNSSSARDKQVQLAIQAQELQQDDSPDNFVELWIYLTVQAERAVQQEDPDQIRIWLQKMSYLMVKPNVTDKERETFKQFVACFAKIDPLYGMVMGRLRPMIAATPGLIQSDIYKGQDDEVKEQMRYVLYYAEIMGEVIRNKKGRSYQLYLSD